MNACPEARSPQRSGHVSVTHGDHIMFVTRLPILFPFFTTHCRFGGTDGQYHYNDAWPFDVSIRKWTELGLIIDDDADFNPSRLLQNTQHLHLNASLVQEPVRITQLPACQLSSLPLSTSRAHQIPGPATTRFLTPTSEDHNIPYTSTMCSADARSFLSSHLSLCFCVRDLELVALQV